MIQLLGSGLEIQGNRYCYRSMNNIQSVISSLAQPF
jgi:hypothetical protein